MVPATGPYVPVKYQVIPAGKRQAGRGEIVYARNPYFRVWSPAAEPAGYPDQIVFKGTTGPASVGADLRLVERGKADWTADYPFPTNQLSEVEARYPAQLHILTLDETEYIQMDTHTAPFTNVLVRQAVNDAINRRLLLRTAGGGQFAGAITCQFLPPSFPGYRPYCPYTTKPNAAGTWTGPDLARAETLVRRSGTRGQSIVVWGFTNDPIAHYLRRLLGRLGYHASLRLFGVGTAGADNFLTAASKHLPAIANWFGWSLDYPGADDFLGLFTCSSSAVFFNTPNTNVYCSHEYDAMVTRALNAERTNPERANTLWAQVDHYLTNQAVTIPLWNGRGLVFLARRVGGFQYLATGSGYPLFDQLWVR
jgi:peptide/nickel transport system substrate-binding protein